MNTPLRSSGARLSAAAAGLAFLLTFEFLRAWAVSMPLFFDGNVHIAKVLMGVVAFSPFLAAFLAAPLLSRWRPPVVLFAVGAAGARMVLQFVGPGVPRLVVVLVGVACCLLMLTALAPRRAILPALVGALAADAVLLMALQTESLVFRNGWAAAAGAAALSAALVGAALFAGGEERGAEDGATDSRSDSEPARNSLLPWLGFGPALALHLTVASLPAPVEVATGWSPAVARLLVAGAYMVGAALAFWGLVHTPRRRALRLAPAAAGLVVLGSALLALFADSTDWIVVAAILLPIGLLVGLAALVRLPGRASGLATRLTAVGAFTMGVAVPLVYYIGFVHRYPIALPWILAATAAVLAALLILLAMFARPVERPGVLQARDWELAPAPAFTARDVSRSLREGASLFRPRPRIALGVAALVITFLVAAPAVGSVRSTDRSALNGFPVRVATYNIFMGLGADVNMDLDRLAAQIASQKPDVIALEEVGRGWFSSGSVDLLPRIAARLGYSYRFFPAADQTWGNAILTNLPAADSVHGFLPQGISAMRRGWGGEVLELGNGQRLFFVVTHLYNPPDGHELRAEQAEALVKHMVLIAERYHLVDETVLVGDLNAESDSTELTSIRDVYTDVLDTVTPLLTYPSWAPDQRIDHIFASGNLRGTDSATFGGLASDHLGIAVTLQP